MSNIKLICKDHPKYKIIREPRAECLTCWKIYSLKLSLEVKKLKKLKKG